MPDIYVEHALEKALTAADEIDFLRTLDACAATMRTRRYECLIDNERRRVLYRMVGVDANAVRAATSCSNPVAARVWIGAVQTRPPHSRTDRNHVDTLVDIVAEASNREALAAGDLAAFYAGCDWCLEAFRVELVGVAIESGGNRVLALFRAPDAEAVRQAFRHDSSPFDRISALQRLAVPAEDVVVHHRSVVSVSE
jgi:hypothetical protein